jgi:DNA-binding XRE family transcriptional regulator
MRSRSLNGLRLHRLAARLDQASLAQRVGVTRQLISKLETGKISPRLDVARRLAEILDADLEALFPSEQPVRVAARRHQAPVSGRG